MKGLASLFWVSFLFLEVTRQPRVPGERRGYTGTSEYTAPELRARRADGGLVADYDEAADMYSVGVVLYAMCVPKKAITTYTS